MNIKSQQEPVELFDQWQIEDEELSDFVMEIRTWMNEVNQLGIPHFGEAGTRLMDLRKRLTQHFDREDEIIESLAANFSDSTETVRMLCANASLEHAQILKRIDGLMERLHQLEPPFESWVGMMNEFESFIEGLQRHEREESSFVTGMLSGQEQES